MMFYAIRHKPTKGLMPQRDRKSRGGFTHDEPTTFLPPRLFTREQDAKCALTWWLKGMTSVNYGMSYEGEYDENWGTDPIVGRVAEDMEVVQVVVMLAAGQPWLPG